MEAAPLTRRPAGPVARTVCPTALSLDKREESSNDQTIHKEPEELKKSFRVYETLSGEDTLPAVHNWTS